MFGWKECILAVDAGPTDCAGGRSDKQKMNTPPYYKTTTIELQSNKSAITMMNFLGGPTSLTWPLFLESELF